MDMIIFSSSSFSYKLPSVKPNFGLYLKKRIKLNISLAIINSDFKPICTYLRFFIINEQHSKTFSLGFGGICFFLLFFNFEYS